jgi:hypothetical protein
MPLRMVIAFALAIALLVASCANVTTSFTPTGTARDRLRIVQRAVLIERDDLPRLRACGGEDIGTLAISGESYSRSDEAMTKRILIDAASHGATHAWPDNANAFGLARVLKSKWDQCPEALRPKE